jgi:hypothetical protein
MQKSTFYLTLSRARRLSRFQELSLATVTWIGWHPHYLWRDPEARRKNIPLAY